MWWQLLMDWLPDKSPWQNEFGSLTELRGLVLGVAIFVVTLWVARRQSQILKQQTAMKSGQSEASQRQEAIAAEQAALVRQQGEIAESQFAILRFQSRAHTLTVEAQSIDRTKQFTTLRIQVRNEGRNTADGFQWELLLPSTRIHYDLSLTTPEGRQLEAVDGASRDAVWYHKFEGRVSEPLFPGTRVVIAHLRIGPPYTVTPFRFTYRRIWWLAKLKVGDNTIPPIGYSHRVFVLNNDGNWNWSDEPIPI